MNWEVRVRKSRKEHMCTFCLRKMEKGESYLKVTGIYDGFYCIKMCDVCEAFHHTLDADEVRDMEDMEYTDHDDYEEFAADFNINKMLKGDL